MCLLQSYQCMKLDITRHNRKDTAPSRSMTKSDGKARFCPWIEDSMTILSDGTVTCGLDDQDGLRSFGNVHDTPLEEIFANPEYRRIAEGLRQGRTCRDCALYQPLTGKRPPRAALPSKLVIEPTVRCNLRCPQIACFANNSPDHQTRDRNDLPRAELDAVLAQLGKGLREVYFFNYGDPFMHREAPQMIADIRRRSPKAKIVTSTNGIPLAARHKAEQLVAAGLDHIVFTISGMTQESYVRYHVNGRLESALRGMRNVLEAREAAGKTRPLVSWRYLGFRWTDNFDELDAAIALASELKVNDFCIYLTHIPEQAWSYRLAEGTYGYARYRPWINVAYGYNRPAPPADGIFQQERLAQFGTMRWTGWHGRPSLMVRDDHVILWVSTNSPAAAPQGHTDIFLRTPWRRLYRVRAPYRAWGKIVLPLPGGWRHRRKITLDLLCPDAWFPADWLGVEDYRGLGVMITDEPDGTVIRIGAALRPASMGECQRYLRLSSGAPLEQVRSALFHHKKDASSAT